MQESVLNNIDSLFCVALKLLLQLSLGYKLQGAQRAFLCPALFVPSNMQTLFSGLS